MKVRYLLNQMVSVGFVLLFSLAGANAAQPVFATPLEQYYDIDFGPGFYGAITLGIDGFDADGDALSITAVSDDPNNLIALVPTGNQYALMHYTENDGVTPIGDILVQLFNDRIPLATERMVTLATNQVNPDGTLDPNGTPFYSDVLVHRSIPGFMFQTGDALNGDGTGGSPLGSFVDEFNWSLQFTGPGVLAMANSGVNTNNSQFFITAGPTTWLTFQHTIFGQMITGWDTYDDVILWDPNSPPLLKSIDIIDSPQDGTISLIALPEFDGVADVTIVLDDGHGNTAQHTLSIYNPVLPGDIAPLAGDGGPDGYVDDKDLSVVLANWHTDGSLGGDIAPLAKDGGPDGYVDDKDLSVILANWHTGTPPASPAPIPEPATLSLLALGGLGLLCRKRGFGA